MFLWHLAGWFIQTHILGRFWLTRSHRITVFRVLMVFCEDKPKKKEAEAGPPQSTAWWSPSFHRFHPWVIKQNYVNSPFLWQMISDFQFAEKLSQASPLNLFNKDGDGTGTWAERPKSHGTSDGKFPWGKEKKWWKIREKDGTCNMRKPWDSWGFPQCSESGQIMVIPRESSQVENHTQDDESWLMTHGMSKNGIPPKDKTNMWNMRLFLAISTDLGKYPRILRYQSYIDRWFNPSFLFIFKA